MAIPSTLNWILRYDINMMCAKELERTSPARKQNVHESDSLFYEILEILLSVFLSLIKLIRLTRCKTYSPNGKVLYLTKNCNDGQLLFLLSSFSSKTCINNQALNLLTLNILVCVKILLIPPYFLIYTTSKVRDSFMVTMCIRGRTSQQMDTVIVTVFSTRTWNQVLILSRI